MGDAVMLPTTVFPLDAFCFTGSKLWFPFRFAEQPEQSGQPLNPNFNLSWAPPRANWNGKFEAVGSGASHGTIEISAIDAGAALSMLPWKEGSDPDRLTFVIQGRPHHHLNHLCVVRD